MNAEVPTAYYVPCANCGTVVGPCPTNRRRQFCGGDCAIEFIFANRRVGSRGGRPTTHHPEFADLLPHPRPCRCKECNARYVQLLNLKKRGLPLSGDRTRACDCCGYSFAPRNWSRSVCSEACRYGKPANSSPLVYCVDCNKSIPNRERRVRAGDVPRCVPCVDRKRNRTERRRKDRSFIRTYLYDAVFDRYGGVCHLCSGVVPVREWTGLPDSGTVDHVIPVAHGGSDAFDNLALAHLYCNVRRRDLTLDAWFEGALT